MKWPSLAEYETFEAQVVGCYGSSVEEALPVSSVCAQRHTEFKAEYTDCTDMGPVSVPDAKEALLKVLSAISGNMMVHYTTLQTKKKKEKEAAEKNKKTPYISSTQVLSDLGLIGLQESHVTTLCTCMEAACARSAIGGADGTSWRRDENGVLYISRAALDVVRTAIYYECYNMIKEGCRIHTPAHVVTTTSSPSEEAERVRIGDVLLDLATNKFPALLALDPDIEDKVKMKTGYMMARSEQRSGNKRKRDEEGQRVYTTVDLPQLNSCLHQALKINGVQLGTPTTS